MCGICGKVYFDRDFSIQMDELEAMTDVIKHRGPDDKGFHLDGNVGLGFRRLSIIDLHSGHQPLSNEDATVWIVFNGEIYNYRQLRRDLIDRGHQFKTESDTEVIVHLYEEYGKDCVKLLRGMFAFAIWDHRKRTLFCARDRFGIKPFFYYFDNKRFVFGSEIKSLLTDASVDRTISSQALDHYLTFGYSPPDATIYEQIKKLKPAHTLELRSGAAPIFTNYWEIKYQPDYTKSEEEWCQLIEHELSESVKMRLVSDVPLGAFLSGGIDSSSVVALMAQNSDLPVKTFSIGFKEEEFNELQYAREVAVAYGTEHHEQIVEPESVNLLSKLVDAYDEPFADTSAIPTYYVSKFAREYVTVALSGDGGDELFAGYDKYTRFKNIHDFNITPDGFNRHFWGAIHDAIPAGMKGKGATYYLARPRKTAAAHLSIWHLTERIKLYKSNIWEQGGFSYAEKDREQIFNNSSTNDLLFKMQRMDMNTYMVDDILTKVDRASMLNSLEVRVPILDHKFAELAFSIPSGLKLKGRQKKYILKKAMAKHLPDSIMQHKKQGFNIPLKLWFKDDLKEYVNDRLLHSQSILHDYLEPSFIASVIKNHNHGMRDFNLKIWSLLFLDEWLNQHNKIKSQYRNH